MFDLEDSHHLELYNYLKRRSNGSSYIRTLIHSDMNEVKQQTQPEHVIEAEPIEIVVNGQPTIPTYEVVKEQDDDVIFEGII
jgi:hypothetical protein